MDAAKFQAFLLYLKHQRLIVDYFHVASFALLFYDYILTLRLEVAFIWLSSWNYTKILFILVRYVPMVNVYFILHDQVFLNVTPEACAWTFPTSAWLVQTGMPIAEVILAIRTWAVWHRDLRIGAGLVILVVGLFIPECIFINKFLKSLDIQPAPYVGFRGCFVTSASRVLFVNLIALAVIESVVLGLMAISAFRSYRAGNNNELLNIIHRDGILSYVYLLVVTLANVVIMLTQPVDLQVVLVPMSSALYSVLTTRIIINIRTVGRQGMKESTTELHHGYHGGSGLTTLPMEFRSVHLTQDELDTVRTQTSERREYA